MRCKSLNISWNQRIKELKTVFKAINPTIKLHRRYSAVCCLQLYNLQIIRCLFSPCKYRAVSFPSKTDLTSEWINAINFRLNVAFESSMRLCHESCYQIEKQLIKQPQASNGLARQLSHKMTTQMENELLVKNVDNCGNRLFAFRMENLI